ncbi:MAG: SCO1664 family protein [Actinobacteria bacterium]|nr:SCO1664 family protein [Actinomycetota bacterium]
MGTDADLDLSRVESAFTHGELKITGRLVDASNATLLATVGDAQYEFVCIYKPIAGERPLWDFSTGTLAYREYAAYLLSSIGNFDVVPFTLLRDGPYGEGMVQRWVDIDESLDMVEFFQRDDPALRNIALFDSVINNTDRKIGHLLPDYYGRVFGCDHGVTFHTEDKLRTVLWQWAGLPLTQSEISRLQELKRVLAGSLGEQLQPLLSAEELVALDSRVSHILTSGSFPIPSDQWPSVPWPPF